MLKIFVAFTLLSCCVAASNASAEGQGLSANGGSSGSEPAAIGAGNMSPDATRPPAAAARPPSVSSASGKPPVDGAADQPGK